jgi:hypothetical protein
MSQDPRPITTPFDLPEQLTLIEGVRTEPPACYDEVIEFMLIGLDNEPVMAEWAPEKFAEHMLEGVCFDEPLSPQDIAKCIRIWRERHISNG